MRRNHVLLWAGLIVVCILMGALSLRLLMSGAIARDYTLVFWAAVAYTGWLLGGLMAICRLMMDDGRGVDETGGLHHDDGLRGMRTRSRPRNRRKGDDGMRNTLPPRAIAVQPRAARTVRKLRGSDGTEGDAR